MPYAALPRPSIGLGLLQAILRRDGIPSTVLHANLWFAEKVGVPAYELLATHAAAQQLMGEWTFAEAAFPEAGARKWDDAYLEELRFAFAHLAEHTGKPDLAGEVLPGLRAAAGGFVDVVARRVLETGARVVGCTSMFEQHVASLALLRRVRELDPTVVTLLGGANCETVMGEATHRCFPWVDYLVSGEADGIITPLCRLVLEHGRDVPAEALPRGVLGPAHRIVGEDRSRANGSLVLPRLPRALFRDLDALPVPAYEDWFDQLAQSSVGAYITPCLTVESSRGCWWGDRHQCTFCGLNGSTAIYHSKSPQRVLEELRELERRHGVTAFEFVDNILDMGYFPTLMQALADEGASRRSLFFALKSNLNRRQVKALADAGVTWVQPGIESLHTDILQLMDKGVTGWQNVQLLKWAREFGLRMMWPILWGFPGEQDEAYAQMAQWIPLLEHLPPPDGVNKILYGRFSVYDQDAQRHGLVLSPVPGMKCVYPLTAADLQDLTFHYTADPSLGAGRTRNTGSPAPRPGVDALRAATSRWQQAHTRDRGPVLSMVDEQGELRITDTRSCAAAAQILLTGVARAVYLACDAAPRPERVRETLRRDHALDVPQHQVAAVLADLIERRLLLPLDGRLVGLAVRHPMREEADMAEFPGGYVNVRAAATALAGR
ncbi:RiPP maturation radical SAM protein 1 [Streptomyces sp. YC419]|uniref:RiPP maturation radical SAM protein 1 n=2 Tax=Streptomyces ureilyticus TaxID=1775131 RepID=A0ABX0DLT6_9ACTN|nr:RiPP maturation radical SAM protein 1 [Streptomyces ureilyticus]